MTDFGLRISEQVTLDRWCKLYPEIMKTIKLGLSEWESEDFSTELASVLTKKEILEYERDGRWDEKWNNGPETTYCWTDIVMSKNKRTGDYMISSRLRGFKVNQYHTDSQIVTSNETSTTLRLKL